MVHHSDPPEWWALPHFLPTASDCGWTSTIDRVVKKVLLAAPRGYCAGVDRAIEVVRRSLVRFGAPIYVRKQIVHNVHVVAELERAGAVFVDSERDVPAGETIIFSAHGVSPAVRSTAQGRDLHVIDATCPLVTKVHTEALRFAEAGYRIILIGHTDHEEVEGTLGEAPEAMVLVETVDDAERLELAPAEKLAYLTQTTLSVDDTSRIIEVLERRFPRIVGPRRDDICYATSNRQRAVKELARLAEVVLAIGSRNSSNSNRLVDAARACGARSYLIEDERAIDPSWFAEADTVGVTAGASAPESLVQRVCTWLAERGAAEIEELSGVLETVTFSQPPELRGATSDAPTASGA